MGLGLRYARGDWAIFQPRAPPMESAEAFLKEVRHWEF